MDRSEIEREFFDKIKVYSEEDINKINRAYEYALKYHTGQYRKSGEEYIIHPLNVALILIDLSADSDTICAGLLHDTLEDTVVTYDMLEKEFGSTITKLVDGVTKLKTFKNLSAEDIENANTRKFSEAIVKDPRIIVIKIVDRLHNMRTLQFQTPTKQTQKSVETLKIYAPLANRIGLSFIQKELEDLSLHYLYPRDYQKISTKLNIIYNQNEQMLLEMIDKISDKLKDNDINSDIKIRTIHIYRAYRELKEVNKITDIHNLLALKLLVNDIKECYLALGCVHSLYKPLNEEFKDYIFNPKTNLYQSIHTTVFAPNNNFVQNRIRTYDMDELATYGIASYWKRYKGEGYERMLSDMNDKFPFLPILKELNDPSINNLDFVNKMVDEILENSIYVYTIGGDKVELPQGSTIIDFAYKVHTDIGNNMVGAFVNGRQVPYSFPLKNDDIVKIVTDKMAHPHEMWLKFAKTTRAKKKIKEYFNKNM